MEIKLNLSYYANIMLDAFRDQLCSKLCWHNMHGPNHMSSYSDTFICRILQALLTIIYCGHPNAISHFINSDDS